MRIEESQTSLEAQELRLTERTSEREVEQALKASFVKKDQKLKNMVGRRSQKSSILMRNIRRKTRSMTKEWFNVTVVSSLATLLEIVGQTKKKQK